MISQKSPARLGGTLHFSHFLGISVIAHDTTLEPFKPTSNYA